MNTNNFVLNRFFTQNVLSEAIKEYDRTLYGSIIKRYVIDSETKDNGKVISEVYNLLGVSYRNEYFYKNTLLNLLLIEKHNLETTTALTEVRIRKSKADFILINGKAIVYEIKTELDNFERLDNQINDYYKAFTHVCVVSCENNYEKLNNKLSDSSVGIYVLTNQNRLSIKKEPGEYKTSLDHSTIFKILHKKEFERILFSYFGFLPRTSQVFYYEKCLELFITIPISDAYQLTLQELKNRNKISFEEFQGIPYELKFLIYFSRFSGKDFHLLKNFLYRKFES